MRMIEGVLAAARPQDGRLAFGVDPVVGEAMQELRAFQYHYVYRSPQVHNEFVKASKVLRELFEYCLRHTDFLQRRIGDFARSASLERRVCDFIASMTDRYAMMLYREILEPTSVV